MDTSISSLKGLTLRDLAFSEFDEERELARKSLVVVLGLVKQLKPILRYVSVPIVCQLYANKQEAEHLRGIQLLKGFNYQLNREEILFLREDGASFVATECKFSPPTECRFYKGSYPHFHEMIEGPGALERYPLREILEVLQGLLRNATEKREAHLASIRERSTMLDEVLEVMKRHS